MHKPTIMITGLGDLGGWVLEILARDCRTSRIVSVDTNEDWGVRKTNSALIGAMQAGLYPELEFVKADLKNLDAVSELLHLYEPDVVFHTASLQSWWVITQLPADVYGQIDKARFAPWLPMHFLLTNYVMQAVKQSAIKTHFINACFPDLVNPLLAKLGNAPTVGIGNIDNVAPMFQLIISKRMKVPVRDVKVYLYMPHFLSYYMPRYGEDAGAPYLLKAMVDGCDVSTELDMKSLVRDLTTIAKKPGKLAGHPVVASSAAKIIMNILCDTHITGHAPGPNGLPGGYSVRLHGEGVDVVLPKDFTLDRVIQVNEQAQRFDGVEGIKEDGTVIISDWSNEVMKKLLDYDTKEIKVSEMEERVVELSTKFKAWAKRYI